MSRALPSYFYGDPARLIETADLTARGCEVCVRAVFVGGDVGCSSGLRLPACKRDKRNGYKLARQDGGEG